jgi:Mn-dependent DtxR family transcriptional regulator
MSIDALVLRAMLRLARRREAADNGAITLRVGESRSQVRASLRRLEADGLVETRSNDTSRLTMSGLAIAVALLPAARPQRARTAARRSHAA